MDERRAHEKSVKRERLKGSVKAVVGFVVGVFVGRGV
jgi:hypothetical protein